MEYVIRVGYVTNNPVKYDGLVYTHITCDLPQAQDVLSVFVLRCFEKPGLTEVAGSVTERLTDRVKLTFQWKKGQVGK